MVDVISSLLVGIPSGSDEDCDEGILISNGLQTLEAIKSLLPCSLVQREASAVSQLLWTSVVEKSYGGLSPSCDGARSIKYRRCISDIAVFCCRHGERALYENVLEKCVSALRRCSCPTEDVLATDQSSADSTEELEMYFPVYVAVEIAENVLTGVNDMSGFCACLAEPLMSALCHCSQSILTFLVSILVPKVWSISSPGIAEWSIKMWELLSSVSHTPQIQHGEFSWMSRSLLISCSIIDVLLDKTVSASFDIRLQPKFWKLIVDGLSLPDALCRKQASHLLRCCLVSLRRHGKVSVADGSGVFWWCPGNELYVTAWQDFELLLATLEETQAHIIRPVLPRMYKLIAACEQKVMHFSWLAVLFERLFRHELAFMGTWAVRVCLESTGLLHNVFTQPSTWNFLLGPFLQALFSTDLYSRDHGVVDNDLPVHADLLKTFLTDLVKLLSTEDKVLFLRMFLDRFCQLSLTSVPMMYIWNAIASVCDCAVWAEGDLANIGHVVLKAFRTHEVLIRAATQGFMLKSVIHLTDREHVSLTSIVQMLSTFNGIESLVRGSAIWLEVSTWFRTVSKSALSSGLPSEADPLYALQDWLRGLITRKLESASSTTSTSEVASEMSSEDLSVAAIARAVALAADSLTDDESANGTAQQWHAGVLKPLHDVLDNIDSHTYICQQRANAALEILQAVLDYACVQRKQENSDNDRLFSGICCLLNDIGSSLVTFLQQRMLSIAEHNAVSVASVQSMHTLLESVFSSTQDATQQNCFSNLASVHSMCYQPSLIFNCMSSLSTCLAAHRDAANSSMSQALQQLSSLHLLAWLASIHLEEDGQRRRMSHDAIAADAFDKLCTFVLSLANQNMVPPRPAVQNAAQMHKDWGRFGAECVQCLWHALVRVIPHVLSNGEAGRRNQPDGNDVFPGVELTTAAVSALSVVGGKAGLPVLVALRTLLPQVVEVDGDVVVSVISACWTLLREQRDNIVCRAVITTIYHPSLLRADVPEHVAERMHKFTSQVADMADLAIGIFNLVADQCCSHWLKLLQGSARDQADAASSLALHSDLWISIVTYGPQRTKNIRLENAASLFVENLGDQCSANLIPTRRSRDDRLVRVHGIAILAALRSSCPAHANLAEQLVKALVEFDQSLNNAKMKYSFCSPSHHKKQRLWQAILLLSSLLSAEACTYLADYIYTVLSTEHQPSVKYMCQWTLVLLLHWHECLWPAYWEKFLEIKSHRVPAMCPLLCVSVHMARLLSPDAQQRFISEALQLIMPWCQSQHNTVRAYALATVEALWTTCKDVGLTDVLQRFSIVESCVHFSKCNWESLRAKQRVCDDFFFSTLRPSRDYSIETVFYTVPVLTHLVEEEWIPPKTFISAWPAELVNTRTTCDGSWVLRNSLDYSGLLEQKSRADADTSSAEQHESPSVANAVVAHDQVTPATDSSDVQQKITRLENFLPSSSDELRFYQQLRKEGRDNRGNLILVTSLLEKVPNVGGLCRTCEIFGVSKLVIPNKHILEDKRFSALSVTSEKWIPIQEVKPTEVRDYVRYMRDECGYSIVGVEQTAHSRSLEHYQFKQKTLLLLGNEREGIPVELIQLMDECVEIPQLGVIRSLNVHVSGAILVWEYTKQQVVAASHGNGASNNAGLS